MSDAITLITTEHRRVEMLFKEFADRRELGHPSKQSVAQSICEMLMRHADMEEKYFYPRVQDASPQEEATRIEEAYAEHTVAKQLIAEIEALSPDDAQFDAKMMVLRENIQHHVKEEEDELLLAAKRNLSESELEEVGAIMEEYKTSLIEEDTEDARPPP